MVPHPKHPNSTSDFSINVLPCICPLWFALNSELTSHFPTLLIPFCIFFPNFIHTCMRCLLWISFLHNFPFSPDRLHHLSLVDSRGVYPKPGPTVHCTDRGLSPRHLEAISTEVFQFPVDDHSVPKWHIFVLKKANLIIPFILTQKQA